jgi:hypothetical protein
MLIDTKLAVDHEAHMKTESYAPPTKAPSTRGTITQIKHLGSIFPKWKLTCSIVDVQCIISTQHYYADYSTAPTGTINGKNRFWD